MEQKKSNLLYPVHIYEENMDLPKEGTFFLVAGNGIWLHKDMPNFRGVVPVKNISMLDDLNASNFVECKLPKIPERHVWRIKQFFKRVVEELNSEACTILYFNRSENDWKIQVPEQKVSRGGVGYRRTGVTHIIPGYIPVGTIHSHCDFDAFHSGIDKGDEETFDGLHITFGHNDKKDFTITASIVMNGYRSSIDPLHVLEGINVSGADPCYHLYDSTETIAKNENWKEGLNEWMSQVSGRRYEPKFINGDKVTWAGDLSGVKLKTIMGEGPFEVLDSRNGKVTIVTNAGKARFSENLFRDYEV